MEEGKYKNNLGKKGETIAAKYLVEKGFKILERNYRFKRNEVDIIAEKNDILVFCEIKSKSKDSEINPEYLITAKKQKSIFDVANYYIVEKNIAHKDFRFDVIFVIFNDSGFTINHLENALQFI